MSAGRFHKTLPHDEYGEVDPGAFAELFRSDNTRGLRLGERVALQVLGEMAARVPEKGLRLAFTSFDRHVIEVDASGVRQDGARFEP